MTINFCGTLSIPQTVIDAAEPIKMLNYKTTTPAKFRKNYLTEDIGGELMQEMAKRIGVTNDRLDYVYFSCSKGAEPHTDLLHPEQFTHDTYVVPVILPKGKTVIRTETAAAEVHLGGIYHFNHEKTHSMSVEDTESGCVVIMVAIKK